MVVLVSHDMLSLRELCTRGLWIQQGRLVADGPIDQVIDRYLESMHRRQRPAVSIEHRFKICAVRSAIETIENHCSFRRADDR